MALVLLAQTPAASAYPEPDIVSNSWKLDFSWSKPQPIAYKQSDGSYKWYWYMPYKVVNNTDQKVLFIPEVTLATDTGKIVTAGEDVPASLFPRIKERLRNPLLESPIEVVGEILRGEDFAKESVIIWPAFKNDVDELSIFVAGLSGETATVKDPLSGEPVMMRRTLMMRYKLPGSPETPQSQPVVLEGQQEVMR